MTEPRENNKGNIFANIFRLTLGIIGLVAISPFFPEAAALFHIPAPTDPLSGILVSAGGFVLILIACQDPNEKSEDSCDAAP